MNQWHFPYTAPDATSPKQLKQILFGLFVLPVSGYLFEAELCLELIILSLAPHRVGASCRSCCRSCRRRRLASALPE